MATYLLGDIHGCYAELCLLLKKVSFSPLKDTLWLTGDLVSRGPKSLQVLRYIRSLGPTVRLVLGNHDIKFISIYNGITRPKLSDNLTELLEAHDAKDLMEWLRLQPLLQIDENKKIVMSHAGIFPQWDLETTKKYAKEVELMLASSDYLKFLQMLDHSANRQYLKNENLNRSNFVRLRFITNVLTRMRYCLPNGTLDLACKVAPPLAKKTLVPWFNIPRPKKFSNVSYTMVFGHWASLTGKYTPDGIMALDTGCCWGGNLTMFCWEDHYYLSHSCTNKRLNVEIN
ncbi:MAG: bis(5'-nucleosyl)-tetraphosphatase (symmetrical) ApaH [Candidatus Dasytiphilus stammeri]